MRTSLLASVVAAFDSVVVLNAKLNLTRRGALSRLV